ncbi:acidic phospholipase A2 E-like isoform X2 [Hypanus sabinus]|uniref:acidic phospholipase A2 E-like isoform X2 n=1 Tax=Hypanus sabinus TaxID=79690 RepID=UPI0028C44B01|nr:acidic phospholipase A2 E-like isoform X2 [Hypanus sabinus]
MERGFFCCWGSGKAPNTRQYLIGPAPEITKPGKAPSVLKNSQAVRGPPPRRQRRRDVSPVLEGNDRFRSGHSWELLGLVLPVGGGRFKRQLEQLGSMIECRVGEGRWLTWIDYLDYGCYCGIGGQGQPLDGIDGCCRLHDICYGKLESKGGCRWYHYPYWTHYTWICGRKQSLACVDPHGTCARSVCDCDKKLVDCFSRSSYDPDLRGINKDVMCQP